MISAAKPATPALPPAPVAPAPIEQRYCRQCDGYKPAKYFPAKRRGTLCSTCIEHNRQRAESQQIDPQQDERIAAMRAELGPVANIEIQLPGVEAWVQQYIAAYGGLEAAMNHILKQLAWVEENKPGSKVIFDVHMGFLKMHMAVAAMKEQRERTEPQMNLSDAFRTFNMIAEKYQPALAALPQPTGTEAVEP